VPFDSSLRSSLSARSAQGEGAFAPSPRRQRRAPSRRPGHVRPPFDSSLRSLRDREDSGR